MTETEKAIELEQQLEVATAKIAALETENNGLAVQAKTFADENAALAAEKADLISQLSAAHSDLEAAGSQNASLAQANEELSATVAKLQNKNAKYENPSFKHGDDEYEVLAKTAIVPGYGPVTATDIVANEELQAALIARQAGVIRKKL